MKLHGSRTGQDLEGSQGLGLRAGLGKSGLELLTLQVNRLQRSEEVKGRPGQSGQPGGQALGPGVWRLWCAHDVSGQWWSRWDQREAREATEVGGQQEGPKILS